MPVHTMLQPPVPRFDSVRVRLSTLSWETGIENFFTQNIPFSYSSGRILAQRLVSMMIPFLQDQVPPYHLYELGAGLGWLSIHVLDALLELRPDLYEQSFIHVTEVSPLMIAQLKAFHSESRHPGKLSFEVMDGAKPHFDHTPHFVFASYLWDSLPCRHLSLTENGDVELKVQSQLDSSTPSALQQESLALLNKPDSETLRKLSPDILAHLKESYHPTPISDAGWTKSELDVFLAFRKTLGPLCTTFNFSSQAIQGLTHILDQLPPSAGLLFYDYGYTDYAVSSPTAPPMSPYRSYVCFGQYFPLYEWVALQSGATYCLTELPQGRTQAMLIHRREEDFSSLFAQTFPNLGIERLEQAEALIRQTSDEAYDHVKTTCLESLSEIEKKDYSFLIFLASEDMMRGKLGSAKTHLTTLLSLYEPLCVSAYYLYGRLALIEKNPTLAESYFKKSLSVCKEYPPLFSSGVKA